MSTETSEPVLNLGKRKEKYNNHGLIITALKVSAYTVRNKCI